ncbi:MAG: lysoplasmalogenase [Microthrixaceae bacterium]
MTGAATLALVVTLVIAAADWVAVALDRRAVEYVLKPATMVALAAVVLTLDLPRGEIRWWHLAAVAFSLGGDVFLMLPGSVMDSQRAFIGGLASFLVAHVFYIVGMAALGVGAALLGVGALIAVAVVSTVGLRVARGARTVDPKLYVPVLAYVVVISVMIATSVGTGIAIGIVGALLFGVSDSVIGWTRFLDDFPHSRVVVMVTYHLGQVGLVLALLAA